MPQFTIQELNLMITALGSHYNFLGKCMDECCLPQDEEHYVRYRSEREQVRSLSVELENFKKG